MYVEFLFIIIFCYILATIVLLRIAKKIQKPYYNIVRAIFILGLMFIAISIIANATKNFALAKTFDDIGTLLLVCGFMIVIWESFREGLKE